jgi:hypothetical protein
VNESRKWLSADYFNNSLAACGLAEKIAKPQAAKTSCSRLVTSLALVGQYVAEQRAQGREWADIAAELHTSPDALRKKLDRAVDRLAEQLGLDPA